jgi:hypothetical protein
LQPFIFCKRCRGMRIGSNGRYLLHCITCKKWISTSSKLLILTVSLAVLILGYPVPSPVVFSGDVVAEAVPDQEILDVSKPLLPVADPAIAVMERFLQPYGVDESHRHRVAEALVNSGRRYNLDARLIASIMIVESRANPFAISESDSIGIMQIHLPTWGHTADREGINLFKIEDNIDFGARILRDYVRQFGVWEGVKRYKGWMPEVAESEHAADEYVGKIHRIYEFQQPSQVAAALVR